MFCDKVLFVFLCSVFALRISVASQSNANLSNGDLVETWVKMDKNVKETTHLMIKRLLPVIMESTGSVNLTSQCMRESFQLIFGLRKLKKWAFSFVDSSAKMVDGLVSGSMSSLGVYEECLNIKVPNQKNKDEINFQGQYCMAEIRPPLPPRKRKYLLFDELDELKNWNGSEILRLMVDRAYLFYFIPFSAGFCIPSGCTPEDLNQVLSYAGKSFHANVSVTHCEIKETKKLSPIHIFTSVCCCCLGLLVIMGTWLDKRSKMQIKQFDGIFHRILLCFSITSNFKKLTSTKATNDPFQCIHGIRFLSIAWVTLTLSYLYPGFNLKYYNLLNMAKDITTEPALQLIVNGSEVVDTFLFLGGLCLTYETLKSVKVDNIKFSTKWYVFRKLWRTMPVYYFVILLAMMTPLMGSGPLYHETMKESIYPCYDAWWRNFLFINNFFEAQHICMLHTWFVSCEMQLFSASVLTMLLYLRHEKLAVFLNILAIIFSILYTGIISHLADSAIMVSVMYVDPEYRKTAFGYTYSSPFSRAGPYFMGILVGYILIKKPNLRIPRMMQILGWVSAAISSGTVIFITGYWFRVRFPSAFELLLYNMFFKIAYTIGVAWLTFCCITGHGGIINSILSWKVWMPLSKLTFLIYLFEPILQNSFISNFKTTQEFTSFHFIVQFFGFLAISSILALVCNMLLESPVYAMEKVFRGKDLDDSDVGEKTICTYIKNDIFKAEMDSNFHKCTDDKKTSVYDSEVCASSL